MNGSWPRKLDLTYHSRVLHLLVCALFQPPAMHFLRREDKGKSIGQDPHLRPDCTLDLPVGKPIFCKKKTAAPSRGLGGWSYIIHPPSLQFLRLRGVPLYPVLMTRRSRTRTHPTLRFMQLLRCAAREASCIKY